MKVKDLIKILAGNANMDDDVEIVINYYDGRDRTDIRPADIICSKTYQTVVLFDAGNKYDKKTAYEHFYLDLDITGGG